MGKHLSKQAQGDLVSCSDLLVPRRAGPPLLPPPQLPIQLLSCELQELCELPLRICWSLTNHHVALSGLELKAVEKNVGMTLAPISSAHTHRKTDILKLGHLRSPIFFF